MRWWRRRRGADNESSASGKPWPAELQPAKARRKLTQRGLEEPFVALARRLGAVMARRSPRLYSRFLQGRYAIELLFGGRFWLFALANAFLLFTSLIGVLIGEAKPYEYYRQVVVMPFLFIGLPGLSSVLALERRAGSLDLALAVPSTEHYFVRRVVPLCAFLVLQGWAVLILALDHRGDLLRSLAQSAVVALLLGALSLFWAVRLRSAGAVLVASLLSVAVLSRWVLYNPMFDRTGGPPERLLGIAVPLLDWFWNLCVLMLATWIFFQYARERLRRPELLIA